MALSKLLLALLGAAAVPVVCGARIYTINEPETVEEAARLARQLVNDSSVGTMATVYPADHPTLAAQPFSLQEYYAGCHANGSLTLLAMPISRHTQNVLHSPNHAAAISVWTERPAARKPRVSLTGTVTFFPVLADTPERERIQACYLAHHPDARWWLPGPREPHVAYWARFDPQAIYYVGGFGDEHYIGNIPLELYQKALALGEHAHEAAGRGALVLQDVQ